MRIALVLALVAFFPLVSEDLLIRETEAVASLCPVWSGSPELQHVLIENVLIEQGIDRASIRAKIARRYLSHFLEGFNAYPASQSVAPRCHAIVERLCEKMGIKKPIIAISPSFDNAAARKLPGMPPLIIIGAPYMEKLSDAECEAVIAHELSHIRENHFTQLVATSALLVGGVVFPFNIYCRFWLHKKYSNKALSNEGLLTLAQNLFKDTCAITAATMGINLSATLLLMKISRTHEYAADRHAAEAMGSLEALGSVPK